MMTMMGGMGRLGGGELRETLAALPYLGEQKSSEKKKQAGRNNLKQNTPSRPHKREGVSNEVNRNVTYLCRCSRLIIVRRSRKTQSNRMNRGETGE